MSVNLAGLDAHARRLADASLRDLIAGDPARASDLALRVGPLYANFARQHLDRDALAALFDFARERDFAGALRRLFDGEPVNATEGRAALHTALRSDLSTAAIPRDAHAEAVQARARMAGLVARLEASGVTDIVSVGIGGSDLGPRLAGDAPAPP